MRRIASVPVLAFALCAATLPLRADDDAPPAFVELTYHVVTTNESIDENVKRKEPLRPRVESDLRVVLGPRRVEMEEDGRRVVLDHEHGRTLVVEPDGSFRETPLVASVAFVDMEMANRLHIARALAAAGSTKDMAQPPRELSILFGVRADGDTTAAVGTKDGAAVVFRDGEEELSRWTPSAEALDDAQQASLSRFLQRRCRLHPDVRASIVAEGHAPSAMRYRFRDVGIASTTELSLVGSKRLRAATVATTTRVFDEADPLARVAKRVLEPSKEDLAARLTKDEFLRLAKEAQTAGRFEDAMLLLIECSLQTGDAVTEAMRELRSDEAAEPRLQAVAGIIGSRDAKTGLAQLAKLDRALFSRPHVLDVFRGNFLARSGRSSDGSAAILDALAKSPWLAGAWKDLGDTYYMRFETDSTWLAWETGRRIAPDHGLWAQVRKFEERLRKQYADLL